MFANILIILFLALMFYWWGLQGFFSALLHLLAVIVAGALAIALWEPLAYWLLSTQSVATLFAWGLSLLSLFAVILLVLRGAMDKLVPKNVQFNQVTNLVCGGTCGILSGILTAGILLVGVGFMPLPTIILGWQPLINEGGYVERNPDSGLWIPADRLTESFFARLSSGTFFSGHPLALYSPGIAHHAALSRVARDQNITRVAVPESIRVGHARSIGLDTLPEELRKEFARGTAGASGHQVVVVDTHWTKLSGTGDQDSTLRLDPTQVRLVNFTRANRNVSAEVHAPKAFSVEIPQPRRSDVSEAGGEPTQLRQLTFVSAGQIAVGTRQSLKVAWIFVVPKEEEPKFIRLRSLRYELPDMNAGNADVALMLIGSKNVKVPASLRNDRIGSIGPRKGRPGSQKLEAIELTDHLPKVISQNSASGFRFEGSGIESGFQDVPQPPNNISRKLRVDRVHHARHLGMIRLRIDHKRANSTLGAIMSSAGSLQVVWIDDDYGDKWYPIGFVWVRADGTMQIKVEPDAPMNRSAREIPFMKMRAGDEIYLYFTVARGVTIESYNFGDSNSIPCRIVVPDE